MRPELELIEKIENYIKGQLSADDKILFEKQISNNPSLHEEVKLQQQLMHGIERAVLKQKIQFAKTQFLFKRNIIRWGMGGLSMLVLLAVIVFFFQNRNKDHRAYRDKSLPEYNELGEKLWADADRNIAAQTFFIDVSKDTVVETKGGIVMEIPANDFLDDSGHPVNGKVEFVVKEAIDPASIMTAGLSSQSGENLLESGGMFFIDVRKNGKSLKIDSSKCIYTEIPTTGVMPGMQLFNGKRMPDGSINWMNPKPLEHDLIPVNIQALDFYPPLYLDSLQRWGYDRKNKEFTDSLYFSFASYFMKDSTKSIEFGNNQGNFFIDSSIKLSEVLNKHDSVGRGDASGLCGINPAKIKAIWNSNFENTIIATREFEERMYWIHKTGKGAILDLYVNNLGKNLSDIDSMAALQLFGDLKIQFLSFASRHDGKVNHDAKKIQMLKRYYQNKTIAFTAAISKTQEEFRRRENKFDNESYNRQLEHESDSINILEKNLSQEFDLNLKEAFRQLGYSPDIKPRSGRAVYKTQVTNTGWCNIDRYLFASTVNRTTFNYEDTLTGKRAVIKYQSFSVTVQSWEEFDQLHIYLIPGKLSGFMRLKGSNGSYSEKLNELMNYELVCIGYKKEQPYFYSMDSIKPSNNYNINLTAILKDELDNKLRKVVTPVQASAVIKETRFYIIEAIDQIRKERDLALEDFKEKVIELIFPCIREYYKFERKLKKDSIYIGGSK